MSLGVASIEPNLVPLLWFALCCTVACVAFLVLAGAFPLASRPDLAGSPAGTALALGWLLSPNVGWLFISTTTSVYLIYEFMLFCCHVDDNAFVRNAPFVNTIRRHHAAHHNQSIMMERNMNLTFPIMDWLFGTSDLKRGLLGHLFNGYDTGHVRTDMRKTSRTPRGGGGHAVQAAE